MFNLSDLLYNSPADTVASAEYRMVSDYARASSDDVAVFTIRVGYTEWRVAAEYANYHEYSFDSDTYRPEYRILTVWTRIHDSRADAWTSWRVVENNTNLPDASLVGIFD